MKKQISNFGSMICAPFEEIRRVNLTSGTSGMGQEVYCHDEEAIRAANASTAAHFAAIGLEEGDLSALLYPLGTMTGGILSYEGLRIYGVTPLPRFEYKVRRWTDERVEGLERVKYIEK
jgi:phenylacetate-coenzyme A ligase PaaK-like adenylate-forming protein